MESVGTVAVLRRYPVKSMLGEELHKGLTTLNEAARPAGVKPLPSPAKDGV